MLQNYDIDIRDFLSLTNAGLKVADFVQVKAAIIKRYKDAYGSDIDLSTASADGIFINDLALIINNILKTISTMYSNLDVNSASGIYLDLLCRLSNVSRKLASNSYASIEIANLNDSSSIELPAKLAFFDKAGQQWTASNSALTLAIGEKIGLTVVCDDIGPITAPAGYIDRAIDATLNISVVQEQDAIVGTSDETDDDLRERRAQSNGAQGVTVLESLYGALRQNAAIVDVKIYNASASDITALDNTVVSKHDVYVILRSKEDVKLDLAQIGSLIYEKLTPGISTTRFTGVSSSGVAKEYSYIPTIIGTQVDVFQQSVYWKEAIGIKPAISITITPERYFDADFTQTVENLSTADNTFKLIAETVIDYLNSRPIGDNPDEFDIKQQVVDADPLFKTRRTFSVDEIIPAASNPDTYFNFTSYDISTADSVSYTITLK